MNIIIKIIFLFLLLFCQTVFALTFNLPANGDAVLGKTQWTHSLPGDNFTTLGRRYDIGYFQLVEANPGIDPSLPQIGTLVVLPARFIVPNVPHTGIVINLAELRIYYFPKGSHKVITYPVGIGREGWDTPLGLTSITAKVKDPTWIAPDSIRQWRAEDGVAIPKTVPPGPDNPLGFYAIHIGFPGYRIHGTPEPSGIGRRSSSGCIRLWPEDIEELFLTTSKGIPVRIINDPYKAGWLNHKVYLESHLPLEGQKEIYDKDRALMRYDIQAVTANRPANIDWTAANQIAAQQNGIPQTAGVEK